VVAALIDRTAHQHKDARILSLAAGHLREADISSAIKSAKISEIIAFDQDSSSLAFITETYGNHRISTHHGSIRSLLGGKHGFSGFQLVYASGLFDYLAPRTAARLTKEMFNMLAPGGRLLVANFAPTLRDIG
jgi:extracellular factor (EF) 3-hydroxypalmitic acid methyl ester biosynthesis protein